MAIVSPLRALVAAEVRAELGRQRRSGSWLARELGVAQSAMSRRLTGELPFDVDELEAISAALDVPVTRFLIDRAPQAQLPGFHGEYSGLPGLREPEDVLPQRRSRTGRAGRPNFTCTPGVDEAMAA